MKTKFFAASVLAAALTAGAATPLLAQQGAGTTTTESEEIVIRKKGDKNEKVTVEFKDGQVMVNGKPMAEYQDDDVSVSRRRSIVARGMATNPSSPFRGGAYSFDNNAVGTTRTLRSLSTLNSNKAMLGVATTADDGGARINSVTKNSPAEKAGLKEADIITKVDNTLVTSPDELTKAIGKYNPNDKVTITYKRDKKEQKTSVTLAKREDNGLYFGDSGNIYHNFNFDFATPGPDGAFNYIMRGSGPRLGLQAQDTEEGKGVKVLKVDEESNAAKAGIKEGDVITQFNGQDVNNTTDLMEAAKDMKDKNNIKVKLNRDGKSQEMEIKIPKKLKTATL